MPALSHFDSPIAGVLNRPQATHVRSLAYTDIRLHVSDLMKVERQRAFCEREHVIRRLYSPSAPANALKPSFNLLFALGNALHDTARDTWMQYNGTGKRRVLAHWTCLCGKSSFDGVNPDVANICKHCHTPVVNFNEYEVFSKRYKIVSHVDFSIVKGKGVLQRGYFDKAKDMIRIVEIKSLDRKDIDWYRLDGPLGEHTLQGSFYYWLYRIEGYRVDPVISYLYGDRNLSNSLFTGDPWKEFEVQASDYSRIKKFLDKADRVVSYAKEKIVPARKLCDSATCTRANNCTVAALCFSMLKDEHAKVEATPKKRLLLKKHKPLVIA